MGAEACDCTPATPPFAQPPSVRSPPAVCGGDALAHDAQDAARRVRRRRRGGAERAGQELVRRGQRLRRHGEAAARGARRAARDDVVADQRRVAAAGGARVEARRPPREREQLEREREPDRIAPVRRGLGRQLADDLQEAQEAVEQRLVRLVGLREEARHRLDPDERDAEAVDVAAHGLGRVEELDGADRRELPAPAVQDDLDVRQRLQTAADPRLRLANALRHRPDPAALARQQVDDAVGLAVAERPQHHGLDGAGARHGGVRPYAASTSSARRPLWSSRRRSSKPPMCCSPTKICGTVKRPVRSMSFWRNVGSSSRLTSR